MIKTNAAGRKASVPTKTSAAGRKAVVTTWPLLLTTTAFVLLPMAYILVISFLKQSANYGVSGEFTFGNYIKMAEPVYIRVFADSFVFALATTVTALLVGYPFSYAAAKLPVKMRQVVLLILMAPFWLNSLIRLNGIVILLKSNGVINSMLLASGIVDEPLKLLYNYGAVLVGMVYALEPFMVLAIYNSVEKMDWTLVEAARDLGATPVHAFLTVTLPQTMPGVIAGCVLVFVPSVGLFFVSDLIGGAKSMLLGNLIKNEMLTARNWPMGAALSVVMLALTLITIRIYKKATNSGLSALGGSRT